MLHEADGRETYTSTDPNVVFPALDPEDDRDTYIHQLNNARNQYLGLLFHAPRFLLPPEVAAATSVLAEVASAAQTYHAAFTTPAALSINTAPSTEGINNGFSDLTLSPQTDQTAATDLQPVSPCPLFERAIAGGARVPTEHGQNDLAHVYDPPLWNMGPDIGGDEFGGWLNFDHGEEATEGGPR